MFDFNTLPHLLTWIIFYLKKVQIVCLGLRVFLLLFLSCKNILWNLNVNFPPHKCLANIFPIIMWNYLFNCSHCLLIHTCILHTIIIQFRYFYLMTCAFGIMAKKPIKYAKNIKTDFWTYNLSPLCIFTI